MELSRTYIKTDRNGTKYYEVKYECNKCHGKGKIPCFTHIEGGVCFDCNGSGFRLRDVKKYTEAYAAKLNAKRQAKADAKAREEQALRDAWKPLEIIKEKLRFFNFGEIIGIVINAKSGLPVQRYDEGSDWLYDSNKSKCLSKRGYYLSAMDNADVLAYKGGIFQIVPMNWEEIIKVDRVRMELDWQDDGEISTAFHAKYDYTYPRIPASKKLGSVGERITITARIVSVDEYNTHFGPKYYYKFLDRDFNVMVWDTSKNLELAVDTSVNIIATVKEYHDWSDEGFRTELTRCKVSAA